MGWKQWTMSSPSLHELRNKLQFLHKDQRGHSGRWWWKCVWSHQLCFHPAVTDAAAGISAAPSALSSPSVNRKVMPTQRCSKTLKFLSERRGWHLLSSADVPSRNTVQGQPTLLPRFLGQWNSSCHKTNLCKVRFVQTKKKSHAGNVSLSGSDLSLYQWKSWFWAGDQSSAAWMQSIVWLGDFLFMLYYILDDRGNINHTYFQLVTWQRVAIFTKSAAIFQPPLHITDWNAHGSSLPGTSVKQQPRTGSDGNGVRSQWVRSSGFDRAWLQSRCTLAFVFRLWEPETLLCPPELNWDYLWSFV